MGTLESQPEMTTDTAPGSHERRSAIDRVDSRLSTIEALAGDALAGRAARRSALRAIVGLAQGCRSILESGADGK